MSAKPWSAVFPIISLGILAAIAGPFWWSTLVEGFENSDATVAALAIPLAAALVFRDRKRLFVFGETNLYGPILLTCGTLLCIWGITNEVTSAEEFGFVLVTIGVLAAMTRSANVRYWLPVFLVLMFSVQIPAVVNRYLSIPLASANASLVGSLSELFGYEAIVQGSLVKCSQVELHVVDACDGLRVFWAVLLFTFVQCVWKQLTLLQGFVVLLFSPLIALLCNSIRIVVVGMAYTFLSPQTSHLIHDLIGFAMMGGAWFLPLLLISVLHSNVPSVETAPKTGLTTYVTRSLTPLATVLLMVCMTSVLSASHLVAQRGPAPSLQSERIDSAMQTVSYRIEDYVGQADSIGERQLAVLKPDAILTRRYQEIHGRGRFLLTVCFHENGKNHRGHAVPNCYKSLGWSVTPADIELPQQSWCVASQSLYRADRVSGGISESIIVYSGIMRLRRDLPNPKRASSPLLRTLIVFPTECPPEQIKRLTDTITNQLGSGLYRDSET